MRDREREKDENSTGTQSELETILGTLLHARTLETLFLHSPFSNPGFSKSRNHKFN